MGFYEKEVHVTQVRVTNTSGSDYSQGDFVYEQGYFGNVVEPDGIANGSAGVIDVDPERIIETDQTKAGDTFAVSTDETPSPVYFERSSAELTDTSTSTTILVGYIVTGGAADANDVIRFKPLPIVGGGDLPAGSIGTAELANEAVTTAKMADLAQGSMLSGQASDRPAALAIGDTELPVGDGTDINAVSLSGDATMANDGAVTIANDAVTSAKLDESTIQYATVEITNAELAALATSPKEIVAAPGANKVIEFVSAIIFLDYAADAITGQGDLAFRFTDGSGTIVSDTVASADFLELTADAFRLVQALSADVAGTANASLVLDATAGDPTTGGTINSTLTVKIAYRVHDFS